MSSVPKVLKDDGARRDAISLHDRSILVEAGNFHNARLAGRTLEEARELIAEQLKRMSQGEPPLSPSIARR